MKTETGGTAEQMNESFSQLGIAMIIAIGAVYLVLMIAFGEAVAPLAIMFSLPLAVVGGLVGLLVAGLPLDIPAMIGALMLIGIVVTNAIVLVDRVRQKQRSGMDRKSSLLEAGSTRMRPILMTAIATIMALVPLASGFAEGALISQSLAVIVIGGLTTSTLLTLIVVPVAYDLLEGARERALGQARRDAGGRRPDGDGGRRSSAPTTSTPCPPSSTRLVRTDERPQPGWLGPLRGAVSCRFVLPGPSGPGAAHRREWLRAVAWKSTHTPS